MYREVTERTIPRHGRLFLTRLPDLPWALAPDRASGRLVGLSDIPALFDRVPASLFGPLASSHATLYWSILARLRQLEFEPEPLFLVTPVVVETAEELIRASSLWAERREELLARAESIADEDADDAEDGL